MTFEQVRDHAMTAIRGAFALQAQVLPGNDPLTNPRRHLAVAITELENARARLAMAQQFSEMTQAQAAQADAVMQTTEIVPGAAILNQPPTRPAE